MQYMINSEKQATTRFNYRWSRAFVSKVSAALSPDETQQPHMVTLEQDYTGSDFSASLKFMNPSMLDGGFTGMISADYLQSVTPRLSLGLSALYQRISMTSGPETLISYGARYKGNDWIGSARLLPVGSLQLSYWRQLAPKIEAGADLQVALAGPSQAEMMFGAPSGGPKFEGTATLGAKYEFRASALRTQIDSNGRLSCFLEKRIAAPVNLQFYGMLDHVKVRLSL
jgi:mitochondrial import receptor subunit TOM40